MLQGTREEGFAEGMAQGIEQGEQKKAMAIAEKMKAMGLSSKDILEATGISLD